MEKFHIESQNHQTCLFGKILQATIAGLVLSACTNMPPKTEIQNEPPKTEIQPQPSEEVAVEAKTLPIIPPPKSSNTKQTTPKKVEGIFSHKGPLGDKICIYPDNTTRLCKPKPDQILQKYQRDIPGEEIIRKGETEIVPPNSQYCTVYESYNQKNGKNNPIKARCITVNPKKSK